MNYIPFIAAAILLAGGFAAGGGAIYSFVQEGDDDTIIGGDGSGSLEVEIIHYYGGGYITHAPDSIQLQSYVRNGDGEISYVWQWEDETTLSTEPNLIFEISENVPSAYYTINLGVTDEDGDFDSDSLTFEVGPPAGMTNIIDVDIGNEFPEDVETDFSVDPSINSAIFAFPRVDGPPPVEVSFTATDIPWTVTSYGWDFGDGIEEWTGTSTSHVYYSSGNFTVTLSVATPGDITVLCTAGIMILEEEPEDPVTLGMDLPQISDGGGHQVFSLDVLADPIQGQAPLYVNFNTNIAPAVTTGFMWNFGDGGPLSFDRGASHIFIEPGTYHVTVTYSSGVGTYGYGEIDIIVGGPPEVFTVEIEVIPTDLDRTFQLIAHPSVEAELTYDWTFTHEEPVSGDGIIHIFQVFGMNHAEVHVYNEDLGLDATARVDLFIPTVMSPRVHFLIHSEPGETEYFQFEPIVGGGVMPYSYTWYFGDGESSTEEYPTHYYEDEGYYKVELLVEDSEGNYGYYHEFLYAYSTIAGEF